MRIEVVAPDVSFRSNVTAAQLARMLDGGIPSISISLRYNPAIERLVDWFRDLPPGEAIDPDTVDLRWRIEFETDAQAITCYLDVFGRLFYQDCIFESPSGMQFDGQLLKVLEEFAGTRSDARRSGSVPGEAF